MQTIFNAYGHIWIKIGSPSPPQTTSYICGHKLQWVASLFVLVASYGYWQLYNVAAGVPYQIFQYKYDGLQVSFP